MKTTPLLFFLLVFSLSGFSQNILVTGTVKDEKDTAIEFANVIAQNLTDPSIQIGTISNENGDFEIKLPAIGNYKIQVSFIGYKEWTTTKDLIASTNIGVINLALSANELEEVVVIGALNIIERKEDKLIFNVQSSPLKSGYDGIEILERSPNVIVDNNGNILMRNESATVMINGRISNLSGDNLANYIRNLRSDQIKSIEVQTSLAANTDAESTGGVINIVLKKKPVGFAGNVSGDYTFKDENDFRAFIGTGFNYGAELWNIYGAYNYQKNTSASRNISSIEYFESEDLLLEEGLWENSNARHNYQLGE